MSLYHPYQGPINQWHICISGFRQNKAELNGMEVLWLGLRAYSSPTMCVQYYTWDENWKDIAKFISRNSNDDTKVHIYAYSWGAGWGFQQLSKYLAKEGMVVNIAVLCDPVSRTPYLPSWLPLNPLSLLPDRKLHLQPNIREVYWLRQRVNRPCGHTPVGEHCIIHPPVELSVPHSKMEDDPAFHMMVMDVVRYSATYPNS